eukprot:TRINITY_DN10826_c0_g1_i1.p1 TRINITY_DN10826_c0_g1~~TRINITY_DN10826_c0_g1_i1.p1  ORF type:complete len:290 (+),score=82.03 TRINITY_DN10826_c0_g1_i1:58-927(+)
MIILELANRIVKETIVRRVQSQKEYHVEMKCADFDGAMWHVSTDENDPGRLNVSVGFGAANKCLQLGGSSVGSIYGGAEVAAEQMFDYTVSYAINDLAADLDGLSDKLSMMKTNIVTEAVRTVLTGSPGSLEDIPLRSATERMFVKKDDADRATIIFSVQFTDPDDVVLGSVFLKEFKKSITGAPSVDFTQGEVPLELSSVQFRNPENMGFITFVLFGRHFSNPATCTKTLELVQCFRNYLQYHIKCAKSHLHTCMRKRVELLLQVLNRAKQELPSEKKTMSGKTFNRR